MTNILVDPLHILQQRQSRSRSIYHDSASLKKQLKKLKLIQLVGLVVRQSQKVNLLKLSKGNHQQIIFQKSQWLLLDTNLCNSNSNCISIGYLYVVQIK